MLQDTIQGQGNVLQVLLLKPDLLGDFATSSGAGSEHSQVRWKVTVPSLVTDLVSGSFNCHLGFNIQLSLDFVEGYQLLAL